MFHKITPNAFKTVFATKNACTIHCKSPSHIPLPEAVALISPLKADCHSIRLFRRMLWQLSQSQRTVYSLRKIFLAFTVSVCYTIFGCGHGYAPMCSALASKYTLWYPFPQMSNYESLPYRA